MSQSVRITSLEGNRQWLDGGAMFGNAPRVVWEKWIQPDQFGRIPLACRCMLVEVGELKVLCETGIGAFFEPHLAERYGVETPDRHRLLESMAERGLSPHDIHFVILSHLHFDHAGGLLEASRPFRLAFPQAHFVAGREAWERACHPHPRDRASFIPGLTELLMSTGRLHLVDRKGAWKTHPALQPLVPHFDFIFSDGHTPGQMHTVVRGDNSHMIFCGDLVPGLPWIHVPITMGYDRFPERLIEEKQALYQNPDLSSGWFFFTHDTQTAACRITYDEASRRYTPVDLKRELIQFTLA